MQISSRFTMAIHLLIGIDTFGSSMKVTSDFLAGSIGTNPVIVRKLLQQLKGAEIIEVQRGRGGMKIMRPLQEVTFLDIYEAVECAPKNALFHFHENPSLLCPVGRNIHHVLDAKLEHIETVLQNELRSITLEDVKKDTEMWLNLEKNAVN